MSKFGLPCAFLGKSDFNRFSTREIYSIQEKGCFHFFLAVLRHKKWRHKMTYRLFTWIKQLISSSAVCTLNNVILVSLLRWSGWKRLWEDQNENIIQLGFQFYVKLASFDVNMKEETILDHIVYRNIILEMCVCLAIKIKCKHKFMFLA